jgi:non-ribosomal peptide synthetase component F
MFRDANTGDGGRSAIEIVFALAQSNPDAIALRGNGAELTYRDLMSSVDQLAEAIMDAGVGRDVPVGICLDRSFDYVIAMLAASR